MEKDFQREYIGAIQETRPFKEHLKMLMPLFSVLIIAGVFWWLKLTGITLAGDAFCGQSEHIHDETCQEAILVCTDESEEHEHTELCWETLWICELEEHIHDPSCYSDITADLETAEIWEESLPEFYEEQNLLSRIVDTAVSQLGYAESERNFIVDPELERHGYTRYGEWYGNPYGEWSNMFTSFCLYYAGLTDVPMRAGADVMRMEWDDLGRWQDAGWYTPLPGDIVFLDKNGNGTAETTAIVTDVDFDRLTVIEGDLDGCVAETGYRFDDEAVIGYGLTLPENSLILLEDVPIEITEEELLLSEPEGFFTEEETEESEEETEEIPAEEEEIFLSEEEVFIGEEDFEEEPLLIYDVYDPVDGEILTDITTEPEEEEILLFDVYPSEEILIAEEEEGIPDGEILPEEGTADELFRDPLVMEATTYAASSEEGSTVIGYSVDVPSFPIANGSRYLLYTEVNGSYYAIDAYGNAVEILVDANGRITSDTENVSALYWSFTLKGRESWDWENLNNNTNTYYIRNISDTARYLHPHNDGETAKGIITTATNGWETVLVRESNGVKLKGARQNYIYAYYDDSDSSFTYIGTKYEDHNYNSNTDTQNRNQATVFYFARVPETYTVWLDGTDGELMNLGGSDNQKYSVAEGSVFRLPSSWKSPEKYNYVLKGWYDVTNDRYYAPGAEITVTGNTVFYADWVAASYDVGQFNAQVTDTVSTNSFITTKVFDYNNLFNVQSQSVNVSVNANGHSETWSMAPGESGQENLNFIFMDHDRSGKLSAANGRDSEGRNNVNSNLEYVYQGIYTDQLGNILFDPDIQVMGKTYVGEGDHLFQFKDDPTHEYYGYYYYDSKLNAASYNQTDQRFYVYDYLERTVDSSTFETGTYSDFLPFNSPYANTNGNDLGKYSYEGDNWEYEGVTHYEYDSRDSNETNSMDRVVANYAFGVCIDIDFYLPESPGSGGNLDLYGNKMHFQFTGDDDVWVLIDNELVLDIGGIHSVASGDINFSDGTVTVSGKEDTYYSNLLKQISPGEHTLTFCYLERGSSMSNCAIYFNLAPRFNLSIRKEDVLTQDVLNGAEFSFYTDEACTMPADLWASKESYDRGDASSNTFPVINGTAEIWGFGAGNTYYIKETKKPTAEGYGLADGIICLALDSYGVASYSVLVKDSSPGFTVHGFRFDEESQQAYIVATNAPEWVKDITQITVSKTWPSGENHEGDYVTVYLTVTDPDGTVRRIREVVLGEENHWNFTWDNLPKYWEDGETPIHYSVEEGYFPGYYGKIERISETEFEYRIDNISLEDETSLTVTKGWYIGIAAGAVDYNQSKVTVKLLANGKETGRTVTLTYQNGWTDTFRGLPYHDADGKKIAYTVEESWKTADWTPRYGEVIETDGTYTTTVTNIYNWGNGVELPSTGGTGQTIWVLGGFAMMAGSLVCGYLLRRRRERRTEE